jgi:hypothetical protein
MVIAGSSERTREAYLRLTDHDQENAALNINGVIPIDVARRATARS